jgi:hypothetical protein
MQNSYSATQDVFYENREFNTAFIRAFHRPLSWATPIQPVPPSFLFKIHFNTNLPATPRSTKWSFSLTFPHKKNPACISPHPYMSHMPHQSNPYWFDDPNNIRWGDHWIFTFTFTKHQHNETVNGHVLASINLNTPETGAYLKVSEVHGLRCCAAHCNFKCLDTPQRTLE